MRRGYGRRRAMVRGMWMHRGACGPYGEPTIEDRISWLEEYQRDLEQETADIAERIRRLKERRDEGASEPTIQA